MFVKLWYFIIICFFIWIVLVGMSIICALLVDGGIPCAVFPCTSWSAIIQISKDTSLAIIVKHGDGLQDVLLQLWPVATPDHLKIWLIDAHGRSKPRQSNSQGFPWGIKAWVIWNPYSSKAEHLHDPFSKGACGEDSGQGGIPLMKRSAGRVARHVCTQKLVWKHTGGSMKSGVGNCYGKEIYNNITTTTPTTTTSCDAHMASCLQIARIAQSAGCLWCGWDLRCVWILV